MDPGTGGDRGSSGTCHGDRSIEEKGARRYGSCRAMGIRCDAGEGRERVKGRSLLAQAEAEAEAVNQI